MIQIKQPITLAGFYAKKEPCQTIMIVDSHSYLVQLWPDITSQQWEEFACSPLGREKGFPAIDITKIKITDVDKFIKMLKSISNYKFASIINECHKCELKSNIVYGFKVNDNYFMYSDLLQHMIIEHGSTVSNQFVAGMMTKINPIFAGININVNLLDSHHFEKSNTPGYTESLNNLPIAYKSNKQPNLFRYYESLIGSSPNQIILYNQSTKPHNASLIDGHIITDTFEIKISTPSQKYPIYSLYPPPGLDNKDPNHGAYAVLNQQEATSENPQIVRYCHECIGMLMRNYGLDQENFTHSPCLWDGKRFTRPKQTDPIKLCGQI